MRICDGLCQIFKCYHQAHSKPGHVHNFFDIKKKHNCTIYKMQKRIQYNIINFILCAPRENKAMLFYPLQFNVNLHDTNTHSENVMARSRGYNPIVLQCSALLLLLLLLYCLIQIFCRKKIIYFKHTHTLIVF